mgnify:FL=1
MEPRVDPQPQTPPVSPAPPTPQVKNSLVLIMSILLMVAVAIAGLFYFQIQKLSKELSRYQIQPSPTPSATADPTANWRTYTNNYWKISFKYPDSLFKLCPNYFTYSTEKEGVQFWGPDFDCPIGHDVLYKIGFVGYDPGKYSELKKPSSTETIIIDGKQAQKKIYIYDESDIILSSLKQSVEIVFNLNNGTIVLKQLGDNIDEQKAFDLILSTFKFIEVTPSASPTATPSSSQ